jgi:hypothetical protein
VKTRDGQHDFTGTEHLATLSPKKRWIVHRLLRHGYVRIASSEGVMWLAYGDVWNPADPCNLMVEVTEKSSNSVATFRMTAAPDVHVQRHITLSCEDGWERLAAFESFFLTVRSAALSDVRVQERAW